MKAKRILKGILKAFGTFLLTCVLAGLVFVCIFAVYVKTYLQSQIDFSMEDIALDQTSVIYYWDDDTGSYQELQKLYASENRTLVSYEKIPSNLKFATVAIEDKRFYEHKGVDWLRTIKASVNLFLGGDSSYGASTITQQLVKNLTGKEEVTVRRKLVEIFTALELEKKYTKDDILEKYLNTIYLGEGCYGVQSAAQHYYGKSVSELTLAECASLISITNNPSIYDPYTRPEKNRERQLLVLGEMLDQGYIDQSEYDQAVAQEMLFQMSSDEDEQLSASSYYSYFVDQVVYDVTADLMAQTGYSYDQAYELLTTGGYKIYCTIDLDVQEKVDQIYTDLTNVPETASSQQLQSAIVIIDNESGDVVALAGGVGKKEGSLVLNRATQSKLSPGSTIKPVSVYAPALETGLITPATVYDDTPYSFTDKSSWPKNQDATYRGLVSVDRAMSLSLNTVAVKIVDQLTPEYCYDFAKYKMGLSGLVDNYTSNGQSFSDAELSPMAMGSLTVGVTVQDMAAAYATFPNGGTYREARTYTKVTDNDGDIILDNTQTTSSAMSETSAWYITYMLEHVVTSGTGTAAQLDGMHVAGKTGTTTSDYDRWFAGYTPYYTGVVWCGYDEPEEVKLTNSSTNPAVSLWKQVMQLVHEGKADREFTQPSDIVNCTVCMDSGLLATDACEADPRGSRVVQVKLSIHDVPTTYCDVHEMVEVCSESGHVANEYCGQIEGNKLEKVGLLNIVRAFPISGIVVLDQQYCISSNSVPSGYYPAKANVVDPIGDECPIHNEDSISVEEPPDDFDPIEGSEGGSNGANGSHGPGIPDFDDDPLPDGSGDDPVDPDLPPWDWTGE